MEYELLTLKDIFNKVPTDKIPAYLKEIADSMERTKALEGNIPDASIQREIAPRYELITLDDILTKVPAGRIGVCLGELAIMMQQIKTTSEMLKNLSVDLLGADGDAAVSVEWPEPATWIDDDAGTLNLSFHVDDKELFSCTTHIGDGPQT